MPNRPLPSRAIVSFILVNLWLLCAVPAPAIDLVVHNNNDSGSGSLRQAVHDNNALGGGNTIIFSDVVTGTITLTSGELLITTDVTIRGPGPKLLALSGNNSSRIFQIPGGIAKISGLTMKNGRYLGQPGGGAILALSHLTVSNCIFTANNVSGDYGGAIYSIAQLDVSQCSFSANGAEGGGALLMSGTATISNSTIAQNARGFYGGAIVTASGEFAILSCTIANNADSGITSLRTAVTVANTILPEMAAPARFR